MKVPYNHSRRKRLSQNYLKNKSTIKYIIDLTNISKKDNVLEIGAGEGSLTSFLLQKSKRVYAVEKDINNYKFLKEKFLNSKNLILINKDVLDFEMPEEKYKIFSNPPFSITSRIIKRFLFKKPFPSDAYFILEKGAARRFCGNKKNSLSSIMVNSLYKIEILHDFKRHDYFPQPKVDTQLVYFRLRKSTGLIQQDSEEFYNFLKIFFDKGKNSIKKTLKIIFSNKQATILSEKNNMKLDGNLSDITPQN